MKAERLEEMCKIYHPFSIEFADDGIAKLSYKMFPIIPMFDNYNTEHLKNLITLANAVPELLGEIEIYKKYGQVCSREDAKKNGCAQCQKMYEKLDKLKGGSDGL